ncbi:MAG: head GIN domain-containing protein [Bacteroidota bacterium]
MKNALPVIALSLIASFASGQNSKNISVVKFHGINASDAFDITLKKGTSEALTIETDEKLLPYVRSDVKNGLLYLSLDKNTPKILAKKNVKAIVTISDLQKITLSGACKIKSVDHFSTKMFNADCSGASILNLNLSAEQMSLKASGATDIKLNATITSISEMDLSGASVIDINGSTKSLKLDMTGSSNFKAIGFITDSANINSSGSSEMSIYVNETLNVISSGISKINYKGSPSLKLNSTGLSMVNKI